MSTERDRSQGWKHAKISGHENEELAAKDILEDASLQSRILHAVHKDDCKIVGVSVGGLNEKEVESVLGDKTKAKADTFLTLSDGTVVGISIKKSKSGQVYLIPPRRFIQGFEKQFKKKIPNDVKRAINLYWGTADDTKEIINKYGGKNKSYEIRKNRLTAETLKKYNEKLYRKLLLWFDDNVDDIFSFCFSTGLAKNKKDFADLVWYKNELNEVNIDEIINIGDAKLMLHHKVYYGTRTGGSTIQLPFGFVQWHSPKRKTPGDMQFHHSYETLMSEIKDYLSEYDSKQKK